MLDPIDHTYALTALEHYYGRDLENIERNQADRRARIAAEQDIVDEVEAQLTEVRAKLASVRLLRATLTPSHADAL